LFTGLCYAEFGARVPKAGSAYIYSYITVGEFMAFIIGWNLILEYLIGTASVARGYSAYIDQLVKETGWSFQETFRYYMPIDVPHLSPFPDFIAFAITISLTFMLCIGVKESTRFNSIFTVLNITVVLFVVVVGLFAIDTHNWNLSYDEVPHEIMNGTIVKPKNGGDGGFFPFGFSGMMSGAAMCFYGYIGFDAIATTGEEAKNPQKSIPIAISLSLLFVFLAYFAVSGIQTLMWPFWDQNVEAPLPYIFDKVGYPVAKWITAGGALFGLSTSLLGAMFPLPRIFYAMASDGLIYRFLGKVHPRFKTPFIATIIGGLFAGFLAAIFDVKQLAEMMSIGTLMAYSLVAISVVILRYSVTSLTENVQKEEVPLTLREVISRTFNLERQKEPTSKTTNTSLFLISICASLIVLLNVILVTTESYLQLLCPFCLTLVSIVTLLVLVSLYALTSQPQSSCDYSFKVPLVPLTPMFSVLINVYLMMKLPIPTWHRFVIWMALGFFIYFTYGIRNSTGYLRDGSSNDELRIHERDESEETLESFAKNPSKKTSRVTLE
jgi:amino acid transporter